jgi:NADH-quinone oxidoreductase subunit C
MSAADMLAILQRQLGDDVVQHRVDDDCVWIRVRVEAWSRAAQACREELDCKYFSFLSAMDWLPNPALDGEGTYDTGRKDSDIVVDVITDDAIRTLGGSSRFQVMARVQNVQTHVSVALYADLDDVHPVASTWINVYRGADWHEREAWEMFGIRFDGHPDLRHIYLPEDFEGFPLRKDFALMARVVRPWPGLVDMEEMPKVDAPDDSGSSTSAPEGDE